MIRRCFFVSSIALVLLVVQNHANAQISFGVTRQNGVVTGGGFRIGGMVSPGNSRVRMGMSAGASQLIGVNTFTVGRGGRSRPANGTASRQKNRPNVAQFVNATKRFDTDKDRRLDRSELTQVATAVIAELQQGQTQQQAGLSKSNKCSKQRSNIPEPRLAPTVPSTANMVEIFVARCLKFDKDNDDALDEEETKRMAIVLIRSLS